ncbi:MAG: hypothetical protein Q9191_005949 [Dirinaria sp. TL-2023a]
MASLTTLPFELQLEILQYCVVATAPLLNLGQKSEVTAEFQHPENDPRGQDELSLSILATCRVYHAEGWKMLWKHNTFVFSDDALRPTRGSISQYLRPIPPYTALRHISFRVWGPKAQDALLSATGRDAIDIAECLPALESLQLDHIAPELGWYKRDSQAAFVRALEDAIRFRRRYCYRPSHATGQLKRIVVTGLKYLHLHLIGVMHLATLLHKTQGRLGLGVSSDDYLDGARYIRSSGAKVYILDEQDPDLIWMHRDSVLP